MGIKNPKTYLEMLGLKNGSRYCEHIRLKHRDLIHFRGLAISE